MEKEINKLSENCFGFYLGQMVYLRTDFEQHERIITGVCVRVNGSTTFCLSCGADESWHYPVEISVDKDITKM